jgi:hypothetical protein
LQFDSDSSSVGLAATQYQIEAERFKETMSPKRFTSLPAFVRVLLFTFILAGPAFGEPVVGDAGSTSRSTYSFGDVLIRSAIGKSENPFTPLSLWHFTEGWLEPWVPPPNGELHLQRGGWVNTASGFFSREIDPLQRRDRRYAR